jgi:TDG/mug DNA glycosylase family protein
MATDRRPPRPTKADLAAAEGLTVPDLIGPGLDVLFCGINPGLWSGAVGHHFARPGNRFWPVLHRAGFTTTQLDPADERELLEAGLGITNLVERATAGAADLTPAELVAGAGTLAAKVAAQQPRFLAVLGIGAWRTAFAHPKAVIGRQPETIGGSAVWVLPNPSGLNAHYQLDDLVREFAALREAARD